MVQKQHADCNGDLMHRSIKGQVESVPASELLGFQSFTIKVNALKIISLQCVEPSVILLLSPKEPQGMDGRPLP